MAGTVAVLLTCVGVGTAPPPALARAVPTPPGVGAVAAGGTHSLLIGDDGVGYGTGANLNGQLTGTGEKRTPVPLTGLPAGVLVTDTAAGYSMFGGSFSLAVGDDGRVYGTGRNASGQLTGSDPARTTLTPLSGLLPGVSATAVAAGDEHSLVLGDDGLVYGTGWNGYGQLTGPDDPKLTLTPLSGLPGGVHATAIAAGGAHSLVVGSDGLVYGAGNNGYGQLTGPDDPKPALTPLSGLPLGVHATAVAAGENHSLVLGDDGLVYGAGNNGYGQLTGTDDQKLTLTPLSGLPDGVPATAVSAGYLHSLVVADGVVYGAGLNNGGQLTGSGDKDALTPLTGLPAGVGAVAVAAGTGHSLVLGDDHVVYGTGSNADGQLTGTGGKDALAPLSWKISSLVAPKVAGKPHVGERLTARVGRWAPLPTSYTYRWYRAGKVIKGATEKTHRVVRRDLGTRLKVRVTATRPGYQSAATFSKPTARITRR